MRIITGFDDESVARYASRGRSLETTLYMEHEGVFYPEREWIDSGNIVVSWWLVAALQLSTGQSEAIFTYMEGPYRMNVVRQGDKLRMSASDRKLIWELPLSELINAVVYAAESILSKLNELGLPDTNGLGVGLATLRKSTNNINS